MKIIFYGEPTPKQSARFRTFKKAGKTIVQSYHTKAIKDKYNSLKNQAISQVPKEHKLFDGPIGVKVLFVFPPLKSWKKSIKESLALGAKIYKHTKPDLHDNLMKLPIDSLEGIVFTNDSRVAKVESEKIYGNEPRTEIEFYQL